MKLLTTVLGMCIIALVVRWTDPMPRAKQPQSHPQVDQMLQWSQEVQIRHITGGRHLPQGATTTNPATKPASRPATTNPEPRPVLRLVRPAS